jgi:ribulose kinase
VVSIDEATALGAAMLGGIGAGIYTNYTEAAATIRYTTTYLEPTPAAAAFYAQAYQNVYTQLYPAVRSLHHTIAALPQAPSP